MRPCATCEHPQAREIDRRLRADTPYSDIALWLASIGSPVHRTSIGRHARHVAGAIDRPRGPRTISPDWLTAVVETAHEDLAAGFIHPTIRDGTAAAAELARQHDRGADRDLMLKITLALTAPDPRLLRPVDALSIERETIEAEYRLLASGDDDDRLEYVAATAR